MHRGFRPRSARPGAREAQVASGPSRGVAIRRADRLRPGFSGSPLFLDRRDGRHPGPGGDRSRGRHHGLGVGRGTGRRGIPRHDPREDQAGGVLRRGQCDHPRHECGAADNPPLLSRSRWPGCQDHGAIERPAHGRWTGDPRVGSPRGLDRFPGRGETGRKADCGSRPGHPGRGQGHGPNDHGRIGTSGDRDPHSSAELHGCARSQAGLCPDTGLHAAAGGRGGHPRVVHAGDGPHGDGRRHRARRAGPADRGGRGQAHDLDEDYGERAAQP